MTSDPAFQFNWNSDHSDAPIWALLRLNIRELLLTPGVVGTYHCGTCQAHAESIGLQQLGQPEYKLSRAAESGDWSACVFRNHIAELFPMVIQPEYRNFKPFREMSQEYTRSFCSKLAGAINNNSETLTDSVLFFARCRPTSSVDAPSADTALGAVVDYYYAKPVSVSSEMIKALHGRGCREISALLSGLLVRTNGPTQSKTTAWTLYRPKDGRNLDAGNLMNVPESFWEDDLRKEHTGSSARSGEPRRVMQSGSEVREITERGVAMIWHRIQARPNSYVMTDLEFAVFNHYRSQPEFQTETARKAISRYWQSRVVVL
jgi:hypothetical protein